MEKIILLVNLANEQTQRFVVDNNQWENDIKKLNLSDDKLMSLYNICADVLKHNACRLIDDKDNDRDADITIVLSDGVPNIHINSKDDIKIITPIKIDGNCVDRFVTYNMNTFIARMQYLYEQIRNGNSERKNVISYHDSAVFEKDFNTLIKIKTYCEQMAAKTEQFMEDLTYVQYT